jgi:hypothetical protein
LLGLTVVVLWTRLVGLAAGLLPGGRGAAGFDLLGLTGVVLWTRLVGLAAGLLPGGRGAAGFDLLGLTVGLWLGSSGRPDAIGRAGSLVGS